MNGERFWTENSYIYNAEQLSLQEALKLEFELYETIEGIIKEKMRGWMNIT